MISLLLWRSSARYLLRHPWQLLLSLLGIALGVAVVVAVDLANESARRSFELSSERLSGRATHQITGDSTGVPEQIYVDLRLKQGVRDVAPVVSGYASPVLFPAKTLQILGGDVFAEVPFRNYLNNISQTTLNLRLLAEADSAFLTSRTATALEVKTGDKLAIWVGESQRELRIIGIWQSDDSALDNLLVVDIATAQALFNYRGHLSHIDLILPDDAVVKRVRQLLPPHLRLQAAAERQAGTARLSEAFHFNLTAMSLLALLIGAFLIYNSMSFAVVQRRQLYGQLRTLGITRTEIKRLVLAEAICFGVCGALIGLTLGVWLGHFLVELTLRTVTDLYYVLSIRQTFIPGISLLKGFCLGVVMALLAAWLPAREASNVAPRSALNRSSLEIQTRQSSPWLAVIGALVMAMGGLLLLLPGLWTGFAALFVIVIGGAMLMPMVLVLAVNLLLHLFSHINGFLWRMALRDVTRHLSRTGVASAALMIALASAIGVGVMVDSFRQTFSYWLEDTLNADIYIAPVSRLSNDASATLNPEVLAYLQNMPEIVGINTYRGFNISFREHYARLSVVELSSQAMQSYQLLESQGEVWPQFASGAILITESLAYRHKLRAGNEITLNTPTKSQKFSIAAIYKDFGSEHGRILMSRKTYARFWREPKISTASIYLKSDINPEQAISRLESEIGALQALRFTNQQSLKKLSLMIFERTFTITNVLQLLVVGVAFVGLLSALLALNLERGRAFAMLRAQGMLGHEIGSLMMLNSAAVGVIAGVMALPMGVLLSVLLIDVINRRAFGWSMEIHIEPALLLQTVLLALLAALTACVIPAWRAMFARPAEALQRSFL